MHMTERDFAKAYAERKAKTAEEDERSFVVTGWRDSEAGAILPSNPKPFTSREFSHLYTLETGDKWAWFGDYVVICNADKIPFAIDLATGEKKNLGP